MDMGIVPSGLDETMEKRVGLITAKAAAEKERKVRFKASQDWGLSFQSGLSK